MSDFICSALSSVFDVNPRRCREVLWGSSTDIGVSGCTSATSAPADSTEVVSEDAVEAKDTSDTMDEGVYVHIDSSDSSQVKIFCNLPDQSTVHFPIFPICVSEPKEYSSQDLYEEYPVEIRVNGKIIEDLTKCLHTYWGDAYLEEGHNVVTASLFYVGGVKMQMIDLYYSPGIFTQEAELIYGVSQGKILVVDVEKKKVLGKIMPQSNDSQLKTLALSPDYRWLYLPREDGIEVIDTKTSQVIKVFDALTGGEMALTPDGEGMFVNVPYYYGFPVINYVDTESGEILFASKGGCPECAMSNPLSEPSKLYVGFPSSISVYEGPSFGLIHSIAAESSGGMGASPNGERLVTNGEEYTYLIDTQGDKVLFYYKNIIGAQDIVFSPGGELVYLGGLSMVEARNSKTMATLWQEKGWEKLALSTNGENLFTIGGNNCSTTLGIIDALTGQTVTYIDYVPITGDMVYKPAY